MKTRGSTAKEPNALPARLFAKAAVLTRSAALLVAAVLLAATPSLFPIEYADADQNDTVETTAANPTVLEPGQPFDLSNAPAGSTIIISKSGTNELSGSTLAHIEIYAQGDSEITVRLANGTSVTPDNSNVPSNTAALIINAYADSSGTPRVSIVTEENAQASLKGANGGSGVAVTSANLNQSALPVTEPVVSFDGESGSTLRVSSDMTTGMALSSALGPNASTAAVAITGGTLVATGDSRPAIICEIPLKIMGSARVEATSDGYVPTPAIGSIANNVSLSIEGGSVQAITRSDAPGIGSIDGNANISISGGFVDLRANGSSFRQADMPAIGSVEGNASISVSGGFVCTDDLPYGELALGSHSGNADVRISGGTVDVGFGGAGVPNESDGKGSLAVTGGSFTGFAMG